MVREALQAIQQASSCYARFHVSGLKAVSERISRTEVPGTTVIIPTTTYRQVSLGLEVWGIVVCIISTISQKLPIPGKEIPVYERLTD